MGNSKNKEFYVVARTADITGLGAIVVGVISHALYALDKGFLPIVDLKHYKNQYFKDGRTYKDNTWEYFFEQPSGYTLDDISSDSEVVISLNDRYSPYKKYNITYDKIPVCKKTVLSADLMKLKSDHQSLIKLNSSTKQYVESVSENIIANEPNVLGVLCRGTDYAVRCSFGEPKQPNSKQVIEKIYEFLKKHPEITKIYLATEDNFIYETFKKEFGDKLLDNNQYRFSYSGKDKPFLCDVKTERPNHSYQLGLEYLSSLYILSKCKYFIGGKCSGSVVAWIMQNSWQDFYIWELGCYGKSFIDRLFSKTVQRKDGKDYISYHFLGLKFRVRSKFKK